MNAAAAALVVLNGRQAFDPRATLFAHNEPGFWYDPSDLSSMYQDSAGTTPVTAVEQAVGLILDKIRGLVLGPELVTNGDFSSGSTGWITTTTGGNAITISGGSARIQATGADTCQLAQNNVFTAGKFYRVEFDVLVGSSGTLKITPVGGAAGEIVFSCTPGRKTFTTLVSSGTQLVFNRVAGQVADAYIDNISIRELAGNHAIQPTSASRPTLRARYNRLTRSEELGNADWNVSSGTAPSATNIAAPDGTLTACRFDYSSTPATRFRYQSSTLPAAGDYTFYIWLKAQSACVVGLRFGDFTSASNTTAAVNVGTTWQRFSLTATIAAADLIGIVGIDQRASVISGVTENAVIDAWGADLRSSNDTYLPYQRIAAATDYDTVGFPVYLAFDGSDDSLYTGGSIDFSATDKMTVWAGVTKLSDATTGIVAELSADGDNNNGTFYLATSPGSNPRYGAALRGTSVTYYEPATFTAPQVSVFTTLLDIGGAARADELIPRIDGVVNQSNPAGSASAGTGNFGSYPLYIGRRNNASIPFNGRLYQLIGRGAATSAALIQQAERWVAGKQGRTL